MNADHREYPLEIGLHPCSLFSSKWLIPSDGWLMRLRQDYNALAERYVKQFIADLRSQCVYDP
jgi:hypothetical protein